MQEERGITVKSAYIVMICDLKQYDEFLTDMRYRYIELEGACGGKGTAIHKACVVGDTVGDPFKDTSGPSLNILINLMSVIALTIAPALEDVDDWELWYYGLIPIGVTIAGTILVYNLYWKNGQDITGNVGDSGLTKKKTYEDSALIESDSDGTFDAPLLASDYSSE